MMESLEISRIFYQSPKILENLLESLVTIIIVVLAIVIIINIFFIIIIILIDVLKGVYGGLPRWKNGSRKDEGYVRCYHAKGKDNVYDVDGCDNGDLDD